MYLQAHLKRLVVTAAVAAAVAAPIAQAGVDRGINVRPSTPIVPAADVFERYVASQTPVTLDYHDAVGVDMPRMVVVPAAQDSSGFSWIGAALGGGIGFGVMLGIAVAAARLRRRSRLALS